MIKDKELAKQVLYVVHRCGALLGETVGLVKLHCTEEELSEYRLALGYVLGALLDELMLPLYREYPALDPDPSLPKGNPDDHSCQVPSSVPGEIRPEELSETSADSHNA